MPYVAPTQLQIAQNLTAHGLDGTPAAAIVAGPLPLWDPVHNANLPTLIRALCGNFYNYGRNANTWHWAGFNANRLQGDPQSIGLPLIDGTIHTTNCGGFNNSVRQIASRILGVGNDLLTGASTAETFMTRAGTVGIDSGWAGNVRTVDQDFAALGVYGFTNHSYCRDVASNVLYDASTNVMDFHAVTDLMWATTQNFGNGGEWKELNNVHNAVAVPGDAPYLKLRIGFLQEPARLARFPTGPINPALVTAHGLSLLSRGFVESLPATSGINGHWPTSLVVSYSHLPQSIRQESGVY